MEHTDNNARIANKYYRFHNGATINGVSHYAYNKAVKEELTKFLGTPDCSKMTVAQARTFLEIILKSTNPIISNFNTGVQAEAYASYLAGRDTFNAALRAGKSIDEAKELAAKEAKRVLHKTRDQINERAARLARTGGREVILDAAAKKARIEAAQAVEETVAKRAARSLGRKFLQSLPWIGCLFGAEQVLAQEDFNSAGREAFVQLTGLDTPRDIGQFVGVLIEIAEEQRDETAHEVWKSQKWRLGPAYEVRE